MNKPEDLCTRADVSVIRPDGSRESSEALLLNEHELKILINEQPVMRLVCTNSDLKELVLGRLFTEGFIERAEDVSMLLFSKCGDEASVFLSSRPELERVIKEEKSCCSKNTAWYLPKNGRDLKKLPSADYKPDWIFSLAGQFEKGTPLHDMTASTHSCMLATGEKILYTCEDIGRHNAIDKAVGYGLISGTDLSKCIIYTSGRVPVDMAEKSIAAGIPILASKSLPTAEAVDLAKTFGLVIIGNARRDSFKDYSTSS